MTATAKTRTPARKTVRKMPARKPVNVKVLAVKAIVKLYFLAALAGSFTHIIHAAGMTGLTGWEMYATPFMIDGLAILGMIMRSEQFSTRTRRIGFKVQCVMGSLSLVANVYSGWGTVGGVLFGFALVALFLAAEWLADNIEGVEVDEAAARQAKIAAAVAKGQATRAARKRAEEAIVKTSTRKMHKQLAEITG